MTTPLRLDLTDSVITALFDSLALYKGKEYQKRKTAKITNLDTGLDFINIKGTVQGSSLYIANISFERLSGTRDVAMKSSCSCPLKHKCKHLVALMIEFREHHSEKIKPLFIHPLENNQKGPQEAPQWKLWMNAFAEHLEKKQEFEKIIYRVQPNQNDLHCGISRILKNGHWSAPRNLPASLTPERFDPLDRELMSLFLSCSQMSATKSIYSGVFSLTTLETFSAMEMLLETKRFFFGSDLHNPLWLGKERELTFEWDATSCHNYALKAKVSGVSSPFILHCKEMWYINPETKECGKILSSLDKKTTQNLLTLPTVPLKEASNFAKQFKKLAISHVKTLDVPQEKQTITHKPKPLLVLEGSNPIAVYYLDTPQVFPLIDLQFVYRNVRIPIHSLDKEVHQIIDSKYCILERDLAEEKKHLETLLEKDISPVSSFELSYRLHHSLKNRFSFGQNIEQKALAFLRSLEKKGWIIEVQPSFPYPWMIEIDAVHFDLEKDEDSHWFDLNLGIMLDGEKINLVPLLQNVLQEKFLSLSDINALDEKAPYLITLPSGTRIGLPGERMKQILKILFELYDQKKRSFVLNKVRAAELFQEGGKGIIWKKPEELSSIAEHLTQFQKPKEVAIPQTLQATLRPYQHFGVNWLQYLREAHFGGVLADDMGLGKTLQTLTFLLIEKEGSRMEKPSIIVAPTSLMSNWRNEAAKFTPTLKFLVLHGNNRKEDFADIKDYDVVVTTYPLLVKDEEFLLQQTFYYLILDEAQFVKNTKTKGYQILSQLQAEHRLCLTGTPMENNLGDIWSLFHFLNPGLLGSSQQFSKVFRTPIEKEKSLEQQKRLAKRISPFILRRKKSEVALDLPPKTEIIRKISLEGSQRDLYETLRASMLEKIQSTVKEKGIAGSQIIVLDALLKMRQVCCDPRLVKLEAAKSVIESAKFDYLFTLIDEIISQKRKALIFSSFSSMLALIEKELIKKEISYAKLTGETKNREEVIASFQNGPASLFLISLKAGGTGLNLTAADTVIHYDPWWNPAAENQATDRAHRMGQDKPVFVYKLISEGSIEEKILSLQQKKQALVQNLFAEEGSQGFSLSLDDIQDLFQPLS